MDHSPSRSLLLREVAERLPKQRRFLLIGLLSVCRAVHIYQGHILFV